MPEFTQEQLDQMLADAKKGLFTEEELQRKVTAEVDRRVETGIQKGVETQRQKWEREFSERMKLSAEELAKKEFEEKQKELDGKSKEISKKANLLAAKELLSEANIPKKQYENFLGVLVNDSEDATKENVNSFITMFNSTKSELEQTLKAQMSNVPPPKQGDGEKPVSKADFDKMGYAEKIKFKTAHPEDYKKFIS